MKSSELKVILEQHKLWLADNTKGKRANLSDADLRHANLCDANLRDADLEGTNLIGANLIGTNLSNADLRRAILRHANLCDANLSNADLRDASLPHCKGIISFTAGKHLAFYTQHNKYLKIGCEGHSVDHWLENHKAIGEADGWWDEDIEIYGNFIKMLGGLK